MPWVSSKPTFSCAFTICSKTVLRFEITKRRCDRKRNASFSEFFSMRSRLRSASSRLSLKVLIWAGRGSRAKSPALLRMRLSPSLKSRLASSSVPAAWTLSNAWSTSASPVVNAMPFTRKPISGTSAITTIRMRTDIEVMRCGSFDRFRDPAVDCRKPVTNETLNVMGTTRLRGRGRICASLEKTLKWLKM